MVGRRLDLKSLTADGYGRFYIIKSILDILYDGASEPVRLIDVGGGSPYMPLALNNQNVTYDLTSIDIVQKPPHFRGKYIVGDATQMTFDDNSFDSVISTDVMEHIPDEKKGKYIDECLRVAKDFAVISAPFDTGSVDEAEKLTNNFNKLIFKQGQAWLEDHFKQHKPKLDDTLRNIENHGYSYLVLGSNNLHNWILSTHLNLINAGLGLDNKKLIDLNRAQNENILSSGDLQPPYYRQTIVVFKNKVNRSAEERLKALNNGEVDEKVAIGYLNQAMTIVAKRIMELSKNNKKYVEEIDRLNVEILRREEERLAEHKKYETFSAHNLNLSIPIHKIAELFRRNNAKED